MSTPEHVVLQTPVMNPSILALGHMIPNFGRGGSVREFLDVLKQVSEMGSWTDESFLCMCKLKMNGMARDFVWHDTRAKAAATFRNLMKLLFARFDTEPMTVLVQRFMPARQLES